MNPISPGKRLDQGELYRELGDPLRSTVANRPDPLGPKQGQLDFQFVRRDPEISVQIAIPILMARWALWSLLLRLVCFFLVSPFLLLSFPNFPLDRLREISAAWAANLNASAGGETDLQSQGAKPSNENNIRTRTGLLRCVVAAEGSGLGGREGRKEPLFFR
jgi:hypothetical protein